MISSNEVVQGRSRGWALLEKLGEGDAGEVYRVESLVEKQIAVLKRPRRSAFTSDVIRQSAQIEREANILSSLSSTQQAGGAVCTPRLLDQSKPGGEYSERYFIVITLAQGINLSQLARAVRMGDLDLLEADNHLVANASSSERAFLETQISNGKIPQLALLRILHGVLSYLETIHTFETTSAGVSYSGVLWNDVKADHIFYNPQSAGVTLIDWGNSHYLQADGASTDRQHSRMDDYLQFLDEMGRFLKEAAPDLANGLNWPHDISPTYAYSEGAAPLKGRIQEKLNASLRDLEQARRVEQDILTAANPTYAQYLQLSQVQKQIQLYGELPDYQSAVPFYSRIAQEILASGDIGGFQNLCERLVSDENANQAKWRLLSRLSTLVPIEPSLRSSLHYALQDDWLTVLWELRRTALYDPIPDWWQDLCAQVRFLALDINSQGITPRTAVNRLILALQSSSRQAQPGLEAEQERAENPENEVRSPQGYGRHLLHNKLLRSLQEEVSRRWTELEPDPPDSDIGYQEVLRYRDEMLELAPVAGQALLRALDQPAAQVQIVLDAWERMDFTTAQRGLKRILVWDPDRRRLISAERAIQSADGWLSRLRNGPSKNEALQDFITRFELEGKELRNQVGAAGWLVDLLISLRKLRRGNDPAEVLLDAPAARPYLGWLLEMEPQHPVLATPGKVLRLERTSHTGSVEPTVHGMQETSFGKGQTLHLGDTLDTWAPEAIGSSARVFNGYLKGHGRKQTKVAFKIMRPDRMDYALPLFREEVQVLSLLHDVPGVSPLLECGFLELSPGQKLPVDDQQVSAENLSGHAVRYGPDAAHNFLADLPERSQRGWLPYLALPVHDRSQNLMLLCDTGYTRGRFLPILEGLLISIQICDILEAAHNRNIAYRDHKILHYYWNESINGVTIIDWNIARRYPGGLSEADARFDLVQFGARALHHILTGRPAAGALPLGPTRPEEIDAASATYTARWTYDDQRLPKTVKDILEAVLSGAYNRPRQLSDHLLEIYHQLSDLAQKASTENEMMSEDMKQNGLSQKVFSQDDTPDQADNTKNKRSDK